MKSNEEKIELSKKDFSFVCPLKTTDMIEVEGGHHCENCNQKVHDVSNISKSEYNDLIAREENICVSFKKVATVSLVLSLAACASPQEKKSRLLGKIIAPKSTCNTDHNKSITPTSSTLNQVVDKNRTIKIEQPQIVELGGKPIPYTDPAKYKEK